MKCKKCGEKNPDEAKYCYSCGARLETSKMNYIIIGTVFLSFIMAIVLFFIFHGQLSEDNEKSSNLNMPSGVWHENESAETVGTCWFYNVYSSSTLAPQTGNTYYPDNVTDDDVTTAWVEDGKGYGEGEWIAFSSDTVQCVNGVRIVNGYCKSEEAYFNNSRVKEMNIFFDDGSIENIVLDDEFAKYQEYEFTYSRKSQYVRFEIVSTYKGVKYKDTCISEIEMF